MPSAPLFQLAAPLRDRGAGVGRFAALKVFQVVRLALVVLVDRRKHAHVPLAAIGGLSITIVFTKLTGHL